MIFKLLKYVLNPSIEQNGLTCKEVKYHPHFKIYVISCSFYAIAGSIRLKNGYTKEGINLMIQSFVSYMSDVHTMGIQSRWHVIDRYFAFTLSVIHLYSLKTQKDYAINFILFLFGLRYFTSSIKYYSKHSTKFLIEHTKWHCVTPIIALTTM